MVLSVYEILNHFFQRPRPWVHLSALLFPFTEALTASLPLFSLIVPWKYGTIPARSWSLSYLLAHNYIVPCYSCYLVMLSFSFLLTLMDLSGWRSTMSVLTTVDQKTICIAVQAVRLVRLIGWLIVFFPLSLTLRVLSGFPGAAEPFSGYVSWANI